MCPLHNSLVVVLIIFIPLELIDSVPPDIPEFVKAQNAQKEPKTDKPIEPMVITIVDSPKVKTELKPKQPSNNTVEKSTPAHSTVQMELPKIDKSFEEKGTELGPGAVNRAIIVFVLISLAFFLFVGVKTCRRKHTDKSRVMVRKYGVRTNRSDIEMEPLPLSDEEDYDTLFDITSSRSNLT